MRHPILILLASQNTPHDVTCDIMALPIFKPVAEKSNTMRKIFALIILTILLTGCVSYLTLMKHPETTDIEKCESSGMGLIPMALAKTRHDKCVQQFLKFGYEVIAVE